MRKAVAWYRKEGGAKLATDAAEAFEAAANSAAENPLLHEVYEPVPPVRRVVIKRFPYVVFFVSEEDTVVILDALHTSQRPPEGF